MIKYIEAKHILHRNKSLDWFGAEFTVNLYRGCSHGCIYCDSRSNCYQDSEFDIIKPKQNAISILESELASKRKSGIIDTGAMSDPYNPLERKLSLTEQFLRLAYKYDFGVSITTKSQLIERDIELLKSISASHPVICELTITTGYDSLSKVIEPYAPPSSIRFATLKKLSDAGLFAGVVLMPVLPFLEDSNKNIIQLVEHAHVAGASFIYPYFGVTLRDNQRDYFFDKLNLAFPRYQFVSRYISSFGNSYECISPRFQEIKSLFEELCDKYNILYKMDDIIDAYQSPYIHHQLSLFDD